VIKSKDLLIGPACVNSIARAFDPLAIHAAAG